MDALRRSIGGSEPAKPSKQSKKPRKAAAGQKEMLMPIAGKKQEGSDCEEDGVEAAAQVSLATPRDPGLTFFQTARRKF